MKKNTIRCPHCGCEYLPAEIFFPNEFLGYPRNIIRDEKGDILGFNGTDMNTVETYTCYRCDKSFSVDAIITFKTASYVDIFEEDNSNDFKKVLEKKDN